MNVRLRTVAGVFLWLVLALTASFVWLGNAGETLAQGQTTFTGNSFRVDNEGVGLSRRGFDAGHGRTGTFTGKISCCSSRRAGCATKWREAECRKLTCMKAPI